MENFPHFRGKRAPLSWNWSAWILYSTWSFKKHWRWLKRGDNFFEILRNFAITIILTKSKNSWHTRQKTNIITIKINFNENFVRKIWTSNFIKNIFYTNLKHLTQIKINTKHLNTHALINFFPIWQLLIIFKISWFIRG